MMDTRIKYRHVQCFLEVYRQRSVGKAAEILETTQPAVSKKLKELEDMLGARLLERGKSSVELTPCGEVFIKYASASMTALRDGARSVAEAQLKSRSRLSIGVVPAAAAHLLPAIVRHFRDADLDVTLNIVTSDNNELLDKLRQGEIDLVIGSPGEPEQLHGMTFEQLCSEPLSMVVRPGHPLLRGEFDLARIGSFTLLCPPRHTRLHSLIERYLLTAGASIGNDRIETQSDLFAREFLRQGDAVWAVPRSVVQHELDHRELVELPLSQQEVRSSLGITVRQDRSMSVALQMFVDSCRSAAISQPETSLNPRVPRLVR